MCVTRPLSCVVFFLFRMSMFADAYISTLGYQRSLGSAKCVKVLMLVISYFPSPRFLCFLTFLPLFFPFILKCTGASRRGVLDQFLGIGEPLSGGPPLGGAYWRTGSYPTPSTLDTRSLQCSSMKTTFLHIQLIYCKSWTSTAVHTIKIAKGSCNLEFPFCFRLNFISPWPVIRFFQLKFLVSPSEWN